MEIKDSKLHKNQSEYVGFNNFTFSAFLNSDSKKSNIHINLLLDNIVDGYDYHDFPSSVHVYLDIAEVDELIDKLQSLKLYMSKLEAK